MTLVISKNLNLDISNTKFTSGENELFLSIVKCVNYSRKTCTNIKLELKNISSSLIQANLHEKLQQLQQHGSYLNKLSSNMEKLTAKIGETNQNIICAVSKNEDKIEEYTAEKDKIAGNINIIGRAINDFQSNLREAERAYNAEDQNLRDLQQKNKECNEVQEVAVGVIIGGFAGCLLGGVVTVFCPPAGAGILIASGSALLGGEATGLIFEAIKESKASLAEKRQKVSNASGRVDEKKNELNKANLRLDTANNNHKNAISKLENEKSKLGIFQSILGFMTRLQIEIRKWQHTTDLILEAYSWRNSQYESQRTRPRLNATFLAMLDDTMKNIKNDCLNIPGEIRFSISC